MLFLLLVTTIDIIHYQHLHFRKQLKMHLLVAAAAHSDYVLCVLQILLLTYLYAMSRKILIMFVVA